MYRVIATITTAMMMILGLSSCSDTTAEPTSDTETVSCNTTLSGVPKFEASKFVIATMMKSSTPQVPNSTVIMSFTKSNPDIKNAVEDGFQIAFLGTAPGTYAMPFGSGCAIVVNGVSYISISGSITITRFDAVGGWIEGTFECNANQQDGTSSINITNGVFKVRRDADGMLG